MPTLLTWSIDLVSTHIKASRFDHFLFSIVKKICATCQMIILATRKIDARSMWTLLQQIPIKPWSKRVWFILRFADKGTYDAATSLLKGRLRNSTSEICRESLLDCQWCLRLSMIVPNVYNRSKVPLLQSDQRTEAAKYAFRYCSFKYFKYDDRTYKIYEGRN